MNNILELTSEMKRLRELWSYKILDTPKESEYDIMVDIAARIFKVPIAAITFIDANRQWIKSSVGLQVNETSRKEAVCNYTIQQSTITEIYDLSLDKRFSNFPIVTQSPYYRYYAGIPLVTQKGYPIGVFCLVDTCSRSLSEDERKLLVAFANNAMMQVEISFKIMSLQNINEIQKRISGVINSHPDDKLALASSIMDTQQEPEDSDFNLTDLEALHDLLNKEVNQATNLLDEMTKWRKQELHNAVDNIKNTNFKQLVSDVVKEVAV